MNKLSRYVHLIENDSKYFIFNIVNGQAAILNSVLFDLLKKYRDNIDEVVNIHPELYASLRKAQMIVDSEMDEVSALIRRYKSFDDDLSQFGIIINPTLDCNLRCWYCYETHKKGTFMTSEVMDAVNNLIDKKLSEPQLKRISISFFGGEPLLGWNNIVIPLLTYATSKCNAIGIGFNTSFTTNGVLLSEKHFDSLTNLGLRGTTFQISFDGHRRFHDSSRIGATGMPTYDRIINNVFIGAQKGYKMNLRFNYTPENIDSFVNILTDLKNWDEDVLTNIECNFQQVWQTSGKDPNLKERAFAIINHFRSKGIKTSSDIIYHRHVCYADSPNNVVVNFNGDIFKCTAREFSTDNREGVLAKDGNIVWNAKYHKRMAVRYQNKTCCDCSIFPICSAGCSQVKLERNEDYGCPYKKNDQEKREYILNALSQKIGK